MAIKVATPDHATSIYKLIKQSRHLYLDFPDETLAKQLAKQSAVIGEEEGVIWGFLYIEHEIRPETMPSAAPNRLYLRCMVLANKRSPIVDIPSLLSAALSLPTLSKSDNGYPNQLIFFGRESWPINPLVAAGWEIAERVDNYALNRLMRRWRSFESEYSELVAESPINLRAATPQDFDAIAEIDALAFDPHWHFGSEQIASLLPSHRVWVAVQNNERSGDVPTFLSPQSIVGYTALSNAMQDLSGWRIGRKMHLARIATHPKMQGQGIGKYLLLDVLAYAKKQNIDSMMLNTQSHNERSQALYKRYGFRRVGKAFTVLTMNVI